MDFFLCVSAFFISIYIKMLEFEHCLSFIVIALIFKALNFFDSWVPSACSLLKDPLWIIKSYVRIGTARNNISTSCPFRGHDLLQWPVMVLLKTLIYKRRM